MEQREAAICQWFDMWLTKRDTGIRDLFAPDAVYIESWGPEYHGADKIAWWFTEWNRRGTVERWDIRQFFHKGDQTVVEWTFANRMDDGRREPDLAAYTDSPPILSLSLFQWRWQQYLTVQVQDPDGDFRSAAYAAGTYTAANFQGGAAGTPLPLNAWGAATLLVRNGGPYTFYAVDLAGNETVRTVDLPQSP